MGALTFLLLIVLIAIIMLRARKHARSAAAREQRMRQGGLKSDYVFRGRAYVSLKDLSDTGGDRGLKFMLAVYQRQRFIRLFFWSGVGQGRDFDVPLSEINNVRIITDREGGTYGTYAFIACAIETHSKRLPVPNIFITGDPNPSDVYNLHDELVGAIKGGKVRNRQNAGATLALLRRVARLSRRQLAREAAICPRVFKAIELGRIPVTPDVVEAIIPVLRGRGVSDMSLTPLDRLQGVPAYSRDLHKSDCTTETVNEKATVER